MNSPIFLTGPDRSGTTLGYALLASHSRISMVRRTNMFRWFHGKFGNLADPANFERCLETMLRYRRLEVLGPDEERIRREFREGPPSYGRLFELLHRHRAEAVGKPRWGDKSLHGEHDADQIFAEFPDARIIHMVRDPRDRQASVGRRPGRTPKHIGNVTAQWLASTRRGTANQARHPDSYLMVRYEDLASSPEPTLRRICEFIREDFEPAMLTMEGAPDHEEGNSSFEPIAARTISTRSIGRYRTVLSPADIGFIEKVAGREMYELGYHLDRPVLTGTTQLKFLLLGLPLEAARMWRWRLKRPDREIPPARLAEVS